MEERQRATRTFFFRLAFPQWLPGNMPFGTRRKGAMLGAVLGKACAAGILVSDNCHVFVFRDRSTAPTARPQGAARIFWRGVRSGRQADAGHPFAAGADCLDEVYEDRRAPWDALESRQSDRAGRSSEVVVYMPKKASGFQKSGNTHLDITYIARH